MCNCFAIYISFVPRLSLLHTCLVYTQWHHQLTHTNHAIVLELLLAQGGAEQSGKFLFRARTGTDEHVLSVIYKAQGTHHKVALGSGGDLEVNGQPTGCTDLVQVNITVVPSASSDM